MALILFIDTAAEDAFVGFSNETGTIGIQESFSQKNHAAFVQYAIQQLAIKHNIQLNNIDAAAVVNGPGSYTGLRVGLASAKGLCYALQKPLILLNTLEVMAQAAINSSTKKNSLFCPMLDARRSEVFTAVYNKQLQIQLSPQAMILHEDSFIDYLQQSPVIFFGSGATKFKPMTKHPNALFSDVSYTINEANDLAQNAWLQNKFSDIAYSEPFYLKEFFSLPT